MNFTYEVHLVADGKFGTQERVSFTFIAVFVIFFHEALVAPNLSHLVLYITLMSLIIFLYSSNSLTNYSELKR